LPKPFAKQQSRAEPPIPHGSCPSADRQLNPPTKPFAIRFYRSRRFRTTILAIIG